jgi:Uncharacterized alpha/beta hydrolase domain (DUF2235)
MKTTKTHNPGTEQIVFYQAGIGTSLGTYERLRTGAFGIGLMTNVREAYGWICHNWSPGDEIYLFGFSRGAYTARSISGLICKFGLLTKRGMDGIAEVLNAYRAHKFNDPKEADTLGAKYKRLATNVPIKFIGVWDTVGSLGIPDFYIFGWKVWPLDYFLGKINQQYQFSDTNIHPNIEFAFQGYNVFNCSNSRLALNEHRAPFSPTLWKITPENTSTELRQVWFVGVHCSVGGGDPLHGLSDISLAWMVQKIMYHTELECDIDYLLESRKAFSPNAMKLPWATEPWENSFTSYYRLSGSIARTPDKYLTKPEVAKGYKTNEFIHKSVNVRIQDLGKKFKHPNLGDLQEDRFDKIEKELSW